MKFLRLHPRVTAPTTSYHLLRVHSFFRSVATITSPSGGYTISEVVSEDHRELEAYSHKMLGTHDSDTKERYKNQFSWLLAKHAVGEEIVLYPAYEKYLGSFGKEAADRDRLNYHQTKELLEYFQRLYPDSYEFGPKLRELMVGLRKHIRATEDNELPRLEKALKEREHEEGENAAIELAKSFRRTQMFIPTRAHPWMPNKPPFETVVGFLSTPIDQLGDMFRKFPEEADLERTEEEYMRSQEHKGR